MMMKTTRWIGLGLLLGGVALAGPDPGPSSDALEAPRRLEADGKPIDVEIGHAAPFVYDWNGDGKPDLLVGQFGGGKLGVYLNQGSAQAPKYAKPIWFGGTVPSG